jgi:deoxyribonuclease V
LRPSVQYPHNATKWYAHEGDGRAERNDRPTGLAVIFATDVHYTATRAIAAGVAFEDWSAAQPTNAFVSTLDGARAYRSGNFYERELPCLLHLLRESGVRPRIILIDGYVYLDGHSLPGLGWHLFNALEGRTKVVGVAKTPFIGIGEEFHVFRGASSRPLYVTCVGEDLAIAKAGVRAMSGRHRIPSILKRVDQICRGEAKPSAVAALHG